MIRQRKPKVTNTPRRKLILKTSPSKLLSLTKADEQFSHLIIERDKHCRFPACNISVGLTCSHYIGRARYSTRFDFDNCIALCRNHHYWNKQLGFEYQKQQEAVHGWDGRYTLFMKNWLGERFDVLLQKSHKSIKQHIAIQQFIESVDNPVSLKKLDGIL